MIADLRLPIVDCPRNETRKSKFETRESRRISSFGFRVSIFGLYESISKRVN